MKKFYNKITFKWKFLDNKNKNPDGGANSQAGGAQNQGGNNIQDPINALQTLATQGTRNVQPQMMGQQQQGPGMMQNQQQQVNNQGGMVGIRPQMAQNQGNMGQQMNPMNQLVPNMGPVKGITASMNTQINPMNQMVPNQMMATQNVPGNVLNQPMNQNQMNNPGLMPGNQMNNPGTMMGVRQMAPNMMGQQQQQNMINMQQQMNMRKQEMMMPNQGQTGPFPQVRNVSNAPNFLRQSPSPSVPSPIGLSQSQHNTMVASPATMVASPATPQAPMSNPQRVGMQNIMAPSPSANSMNTPGQPQGDYAQSPMNPHDDQIYRGDDI
jgi:mediator of RNA polymerase II transcription subunit 15